jgi:hypothetical protein
MNTTSAGGLAANENCGAITNTLASSGYFITEGIENLMDFSSEEMVLVTYITCFTITSDNHLPNFKAQQALVHNST